VEGTTGLGSPQGRRSLQRRVHTTPSFQEERGREGTEGHPDFAEKGGRTPLFTAVGGGQIPKLTLGGQGNALCQGQMDTERFGEGDSQ